MTQQGVSQASKRQARIRAAILAAAEKLFCDKGYAVSMEEIGTEAGISRATLFSHFGSKENLFRAMRASSGRPELTSILRPLTAESDLVSNLENFARKFEAGVLSAKRLSLMRITVVEGNRFPDLAHSHYQAGIGTIIPILQLFLEKGQRQGVIKLRDPAIQAEQFLSALIGYRQYRALLQQDATITSDDRFLRYAIEDLLTQDALASFSRDHRADPASEDMPATS